MATVATDVMISTLTEEKIREAPLGKTEFARLYRRHLRPVYAYVSWRVGHRETTEDLTAQVFEKAWRSLENYDRHKSAYATWLMSIARNTVTDHLRHNARSPRPSPLDDPVESGAPDPALHETTGTDPELSLISAERRQELGAAIRGLEEREREILTLKFGGGLTNREIAGLLEISESNAGTIIYRSLERLRHRLEGGMENEN